MTLPNELLHNPPQGSQWAFWDTQSVHEFLVAAGQDQSQRSTERLLEKAAWLPGAIKREELRDEQGRELVQLVASGLEASARKKRLHVLFIQAGALDDGRQLIMANDGRGGRRWLFVDTLDESSLSAALDTLVAGKDSSIWPHGEVTALFRQILAQSGNVVLELASGAKVQLALPAYRGTLHLASYPDSPPRQDEHLTHLDRLEAESIHIMREVAAQAENPVMLYSVGKDSSVMLHLARKAFYPSPPPFPLMHVDTRWKFQAMYDFRDQMAREIGMDLIVHINP